MSYNLGIRLRYEGKPFSGKCFLKFVVVFNYPVMGKDKSLVFVRVRVCIYCCNSSVSGPTGMPDPLFSLGRHVRDNVLQI